jgi:Beta propeller domain
LVIWGTASNEIVKTIEMPPVNVTYPSNPVAGDGVTSVSKQSASSSIMFPDPYWQFEPSILMLLLHEGRLLVTMTGYGEMHRTLSSTGATVNVISDILATHIRIYDTSLLMESTSSEPDTGIVGTTDVNGFFSSIRSVNGIAHVVTTSYLNTYPYLYDPVARYNFGNRTNEEYIQDVEQIATNLSMAFTLQLMRDLKASGTTPTMTRINLWQETASETGIEELAYSDGLLNSLVLIHSLDMVSQTVGSDLVVTSSGSFVPGWVQVYGSSDRIIVAANVYDNDSVTGASKESTALIAYGMNGASTQAQSIGTVPGNILSSYSLDVVGDFLRVATTIRNDTWITIEPAFVDTNASDTREGNFSSTDVLVDPIVPFTPPDTENYVIILSLPGSNGDTPGVMVEQGRVKLGKPKESFTAVRFFDNIAYAVTFERTDPFYVLDLSNPADPKAVAALEISGFSSYLLPINSDNTKLLAIGEETDADGMTLGIQLTLFDMTVPSNPVNVSRYNVETEVNSSSYSESLWDPKATRYVDGYLFMPVSINNYYEDSDVDPFSGTMVFKVDSVTGITEVTECRVENIEETFTGWIDTTVMADVITDGNTTEGRVPCNYTGGYLPRRSMVFNGELMTTYNSEVIMTDLDSCQRLRNFTIGIPVPNGCPNNFF